jgi:hypothetical protein
MPTCDQIATVSGLPEFMCDHVVGCAICVRAACPHYARHLHELPVAANAHKIGSEEILASKSFLTVIGRSEKGTWTFTEGTGGLSRQWHVRDCCPIFDNPKNQKYMDAYSLLNGTLETEPKKLRLIELEEPDNE